MPRKALPIILPCTSWTIAAVPNYRIREQHNMQRYSVCCVVASGEGGTRWTGWRATDAATGSPPWTLHPSVDVSRVISLATAVKFHFHPDSRLGPPRTASTYPRFLRTLSRNYPQYPVLFSRSVLYHNLQTNLILQLAHFYSTSQWRPACRWCQPSPVPTANLYL